MGNIFDDWNGVGKSEPAPDPMPQYVPAGRQLPQGPVAQPTEYYQPRTLQERYAMFADNGRVPYSYYAAGVPTKSGELDIMRAAMPENFTRVNPPPPEPPQGQTPGGAAPGNNIPTDFFSLFLGGLPTGFRSSPDGRLRTYVTPTGYGLSGGDFAGNIVGNLKRRGE
jgi:hypothetical protein